MFVFLLAALCAPVFALPAVEKRNTTEVTATVVSDTSSLTCSLAKPEGLNDQFSYTYGYMLYLALKNQGFGNLDASYFALGVQDAADSSKTPFFTQAEMEQILKQVQNDMLAQALDEYNALSDKNKSDAEEFLKKNRLVAGVVSLESGLQYQVLTPGNVDIPITIDDTVVINYSVSALDGTTYYNTFKSGRPETVKVHDFEYAILQTGLQLMHPGSKFRFWIPPALGFGENGSGPIGPNQLIVIDVEVKAKEA